MAGRLMLFSIGAAALSLPDLQAPVVLSVVLERAAAYVDQYESAFRAVIAEERYHQQMLRPYATRWVPMVLGRTPSPRLPLYHERRLVSDFMMVRLPGAEEAWLAFRDVFEVDGERIHDRRGRLQKLLESELPDIELAHRINVESTRYNLGIQRTFNLPTMPLSILRRDNQSRFDFERAGGEKIAGIRAWIVRGRERSRPTIIRTPEGDVLSEGTFWIHPGNGRIVKTELRIHEPELDAAVSITVTYRIDPRLGLWVPVEMKDRYERLRGDHSGDVRGVAKYSRFRRFEVKARIVGDP